MVSALNRKKEEKIILKEDLERNKLMSLIKLFHNGDFEYLWLKNIETFILYPYN